MVVFGCISICRGCLFGKRVVIVFPCQCRAAKSSFVLYLLIIIERETRQDVQHQGLASLDASRASQWRGVVLSQDERKASGASRRVVDVSILSAVAPYLPPRWHHGRHLPPWWHRRKDCVSLW